MILIVHLGHGDFTSGSSFDFSPDQFLGEVLSSQIEGPKKKAVHLYRTNSTIGTISSMCPPYCWRKLALELISRGRVLLTWYTLLSNTLHRNCFTGATTNAPLLITC